MHARYYHLALDRLRVHTSLLITDLRWPKLFHRFRMQSLYLPERLPIDPNLVGNPGFC